MPTPADGLNKKIARLLKDSNEEDIVEVLKSEKSMINPLSNNNIINNHKEELEK